MTQGHNQEHESASDFLIKFWFHILHEPNFPFD